MSLRCSSCDEPLELVDDNGVTDPAEGDRVEFYECSWCGAGRTEVLRA